METYIVGEEVPCGTWNGETIYRRCYTISKKFDAVENKFPSEIGVGVVKETIRLYATLNGAQWMSPVPYSYYNSPKWSQGIKYLPLEDNLDFQISPEAFTYEDYKLNVVFEYTKN